MLAGKEDGAAVKLSKQLTSTHMPSPQVACFPTPSNNLVLPNSIQGKLFPSSEFLGRIPYLASYVYT